MTFKRISELAWVLLQGHFLGVLNHGFRGCSRIGLDLPSSYQCHPWPIRRGVALLTGLSLLLAGCGPKPAPPAASSSPGTEGVVKTYSVTGVVRKVEISERSITIKHGEVPDYMPAMTMPFSVKSTNELAGIVEGDAVKFRLSVTENDSWIDQIGKTAPAATEAAQERPPVRIVRDVEELKLGDMVPDYQFTNELGSTIRLSDFKGRAVVLTFIFTRCPIPNFCPLMSRNFSLAYNQLAARATGPTNWHLLSVSFDPHHDTPSVLKNYARRYDYDPKKWSFVTGAMIDIDAITEQFNLPIVVRNDQWDHKLRTAVLDTQRRVQKIFIGNEWKPGELVDEILKASQPAAATP
ncbi:MAG: redoxin domain-containing protein [Pedosphaera sp.]|nr:redoxin domain-containing protein [Pedosphaera sp.]